VLENSDCRSRQPQSKDKGSVVFLIAGNKTAFAEDAGQIQGICGKSHSKSNGIFSAQELSSESFQFMVN
jgi:hypothetical protein